MRDNSSSSDRTTAREGVHGVALQLSLLETSDEILAWQKGPAIGSGRFGTVYLALRVPSGDQLAVKQMYIQEELEQANDVSSLSIQRVLGKAQIMREVAILATLDHPNVVKFVGYEQSGPIAHIFMEYVHNGSISKLLRDVGPLREATIRLYTQQLLCGVAYLHNQHIAHRDLKCANLLLSDSGNVQIADFGSAKRAAAHRSSNNDSNSVEMREATRSSARQTARLETARSVRDGLGSPYWMAPELVRAEKGDDSWRKADVWGVGCVVVEMATGKPPWEHHSNPLTAMFHIASSDALPKLPTTLSPRAQQFLALCFVKDPRVRPTAIELLRHPFVALREEVERLYDTVDATASKVAVTESEDKVDDDGITPSVPSVAVVPSSRGVDHCTIVTALDPFDKDMQEGAATEMDTVATTVHIGADTGSDGDSVASFSSNDDDDNAAEYSSDDDFDDDKSATTASTERAHERYSSSSRSQDSQDATAAVTAALQPLPSSTRLPSVLGVVRVVADYSTTDVTELRLHEGELLDVLEMRRSGWWRGQQRVAHRTTSGASADPPRIGWFPCTYVEWTPSAVKTTFSVKHPHAALASDELALVIHDTVRIDATVWRSEQLWALGALIDRCADDIPGWFPLSAILDGNDEQTL